MKVFLPSAVRTETRNILLLHAPTPTTGVLRDKPNTETRSKRSPHVQHENSRHPRAQPQRFRHAILETSFRLNTPFVSSDEIKHHVTCRLHTTSATNETAAKLIDVYRLQGGEVYDTRAARLPAFVLLHARFVLCRGAKLNRTKYGWKK